MNNISGGQVNKRQSLTLHIGLMKTASTYLQHNVFPKFPDVVYLNNEKNIFSRTMVKYKGPYFVSNEDISGCPYLKENNDLDYLTQFERALENILNLFKDPQIIICFREPSEMIQSYYKQYLHEGGTQTWEQFFSLDGTGIVKKEDFLFSKFLRLLKEKIPQENLFIYTFNDFKDDPEAIAKNIFRFITGSQLPKRIQFNTEKRSNPSVKDDLESLLIKLNRLNEKCKKKWGLKLQIKILGKTLNPRVFCQYLLPKIFQFKNSRDLTQIKAFYKKDWEIVVNEIKKC